MNTEDFKRKLTAILSADVQGYSRLMEEDEDSTVRTLTAYRALMTSLIQSHRGHVVDTPGDNLLAEFGSVMDAVRCAVEIQEELRIRNADLPDNRKMQFRIGINLGDIIEDKDHIYGDGINIAARVEGLANGGGICISGTVYDAIRNKLSMSYEFLGEHVVKNIKELVRIYRIRVEPEAESAVKKEKKGGLRRWQWAALSVVAILILGALAIWYFSFRQAPVVTDVEEAPKTIAVLPFENLSSDPEQVYFVDGLSEEILNSLNKISDLRVTSRTSSFTFKGSNKTIQEIASILGVENILEGSVRKAGNALRVTAQLVRAKDDFHLWSKTYDRELKDIFAVQEDIASAVASELKATLGIGTSLKQLGSTDNIEAYEYYLFAQGLWNNRTVVDEGNILTTLERTLAAIDAALALDHEFALAWAYKALIHYYLLVFGPVSRAGAEQDAALSAAMKAIELEPNLADAYHSLGNIQSSRGKFIEAESSYNKGLELTNDTYTFSFIYAHYWAVGYIEKSQKILEKMVLNDPLNQELRGHYLLGLGLLVNIQPAEEEYARGRALFGDEWIWGNACINMLRLGTDHSVSRDEIVFSNPIYDVAKEHLESPEDGLLELRRLYDDSQTSTDLLNIWIWAAYFGDPEFAMDSMEKLLKMNAFYFSYCWLPVFREVRQLPRFKELARELGLVDYWNKFGWPDICQPLENSDFECD